MDPEMDRKFVHLVVDGGDGRLKDRVQTGNPTPEAYGTDGDGTGHEQNLGPDYQSYQGYEDKHVDTWGRPSYGSPKSGAVARGLVEGTEMLAPVEVSDEGGSERGSQRIINIFLQSIAVEFPEGDQPVNLDDPTPPIEKELFGVTAVTTAVTDDKHSEAVPVVPDEDDPDRCIERGVCDEEILVEDSAVVAPGFHYQYNDEGDLCGDCQISTSTNILVNLGCDCKHPFDRPHKEWVITWFKSRGTWNGVIHDKEYPVAGASISGKWLRKVYDGHSGKAVPKLRTVRKWAAYCRGLPRVLFRTVW